MKREETKMMNEQQELEYITESTLLNRVIRNINHLVVS